MKCPRCQHENRSGAKFCEECATPLAGTCSNCGGQLSATAKFCPECAHPVAGAAPEARFASPESYTPKHLAERILTSKAALEGERKHVTVLFADLKGSMELLADRDPEEARKILDPVLERMMEAVHRYEGTVNQVMGDGIMALFGAPLAYEDHAVRACYAALRIQESVKRYAEEMRRAEGIPIQIRVGLNSGDVVVRSIGSDLRMDYTAVGQTTHLAARMEQMASPGTILLTPETLALAEGFVQVVSLGQLGVKGLLAPLEAFELTGASPVRSRLQAAALRGLTRFVGRDAEVELLRQALERARRGRGQVVGVVGEPGVGKSRLIWEFTRSYRTRDWLVLTASAASYSKATTYFAVVEALKSYFQVEPRDDARKIREKLTGKLLALDRALAPALPVFLSLLDIPVDDREWTSLSPPERRRQTLDALKRLLLRESQVQPLVLVFEDLHWIDSETQALLDGLIESVPTARIFLLMSYRPEYTHAWGSKTYFQQLRLDVLPAATADELLDALVGREAGLGALKNRLIERTEGNPFFLEEAVRALVETEMLVGERGDYRLAGPVRSLQLPATAQAILAARIDRLPPLDKRLLQAAAVVGKDVPFVLLQSIADEAEEELRAVLARLQAAEFLYETQLFPDLEYTFKHTLTHEVAYGSLLGERRHALHATLVMAHERIYAGRLTEHLERLVHHATRGEIWDKAVVYARQAGTRAATRSAYREAAACFEQALSALAKLPESRDTLEQAIDLRCELRNALFPLDEQTRLFDHLREAEVVAEQLGDRPRLGRIANYLCISFAMVGDHDRAIEAGQRALTLATASGAFEIQVVAQTYLGVAYTAVGHFRLALDFSRRVMELLTGEQRFAFFGQGNLPAVVCRVFVIWTLAELGGFAEGRDVGEDAVEIAEAVERPYSLATALIVIGLLHRRQGEVAEAIPTLERALALCRSANIARFFPRIASILVAAYALAGRAAEARPLLDQMLERVASANRSPDLALVLTELSEALLLVGRADEASRLAERLLEVSSTHAGRGYQAHAYRLLGEVAMHGNPPDVDQAAAHYRKATVLAEEIGMRPLIAHCHLGLGKLYQRTGKREQAQEHLTTATTMYREMGMTYWLEKAEAGMGKLA
jgi:class 3 adenylate cyclase/tetratricopeptide (TPR) repeat protein